MSMSSMIIEGLTATVIGMGIVFSVLALLAVILSFFKYLNPETANKPADTPLETSTVTVPEEPPETEETVNASETTQGDQALIAVISAAVAAYMGEGAPRHVIKSIKPVAVISGNKAWNTAAIRENHRGLY